MIKVKGVPIEMGGETYVVPPLPLGVLEAMQDRLAAMNGGLDKESVATTIDCLFACLKRNYPDMTRERVATDLLDVGNMGEVMQAVMDVSGMRRKAAEAEAGNLAAPSNGASSTLESSPAPGTAPT